MTGAKAAEFAVPECSVVTIGIERPATPTVVMTGRFDRGGWIDRGNKRLSLSVKAERGVARAAEAQLKQTPPERRA
jgi:hypothetical protein